MQSHATAVVGKCFSDIEAHRVSLVLPNSALPLSSSFLLLSFPDEIKACYSTSVSQALRNQAYTNTLATFGSCNWFGHG